MRCGCTSPCPSCPQSVYVDHLVIPPGAATFITLNLTTTPQTFDLATTTFNIPAALPGLGFTNVAEWNGLAGDDQNELTAAWQILLDGVPLNARSKLNWQADEAESMSIITGRQQLTSGNNTLTFRLTAFMEFGTGQLFILGAAMRTDLIRSDSLVVTGAPVP